MAVDLGLYRRLLHRLHRWRLLPDRLVPPRRSDRPVRCDVTQRSGRFVREGGPSELGFSSAGFNLTRVHLHFLFPADTDRHEVKSPRALWSRPEEAAPKVK